MISYAIGDIAFFLSGGIKSKKGEFKDEKEGNHYSFLPGRLHPHSGPDPKCRSA
jgi:hypothetical protein